jgi:hypothetical protein
MANTIGLMSALINDPAAKKMKDAGSCYRCGGWIAQSKPLFDIINTYSCVMCGEEYRIAKGKYRTLFEGVNEKG